MYIIKNEQEFFDKYSKMAYKLASKFFIEEYRDMEKEDVVQFALLYLWEAKNNYDENKGASFSTFAYIYVYNRLANEFTRINSVKNQGNMKVVNLTHITEEDEIDGYETTLEAPLDENDISYRDLLLDIEMQLNKLKKQSETMKGQTLFRGIRIIESLLMGEEAKEIEKKLNISHSVYKKCLYHVRGILRTNLD